MKKITGCSWVLLLAITSFAQKDGSDSTIVLDKVTIHAFAHNRQLADVTASVNYNGSRQLNRSNDLSLLHAINSVAGARMEERSPGSYRLNLRGSTLRSPFGIRNVKVYWNEIPLTDPGGGTYLNQLSFYNIRSVEIVKGPASSMYGAGAGGVMLLTSGDNKFEPGANLNFMTGSFSLVNLNGEVRFGNSSRNNTLNYTHQQSDGYRDHTNMRRDIITWESAIKCNGKQELKANVFYGDLYYQTPGALTKSEFIKDPKMARPKTATLPSADQAKAAIFQKTFLAGIRNKFILSEKWHNNTMVYGAFTSFKNPTFRSYERRTEPHFGARTDFQWQQHVKKGIIQLLIGAEAQRGFFNTKTFSNANGTPGTMQTDDDLSNWTYFFFTQADLKLDDNLNITAGASYNRSAITITRLSVASFVPIKRTYEGQWAPRIAVTKKVLKNVWIYAAASKGFSPPTAGELLPGSVNINTSLQPESGKNTEFGVRGNFFHKKLNISMTQFFYALKNAIVVRKDASNADYYVNSGGTKQNGTEIEMNYRLFTAAKGFVSDAILSLAYTHSDFHYSQFKQGNNDYSGKQLPSVPAKTVSISGDIFLKKSVFINVNYYYSDPIFLNDANTSKASEYHLFSCKIGWKINRIQSLPIQIFIGADNLFDETYSLGNDINAAGDRFYNCAPGRNYYAGIKLQWNKKQ